MATHEMRCIAHLGDELFLLSDGENGVIADTDELVRYAPRPLESVIKFGPWEDCECGSDALRAMLEFPEVEE